MKETKQIKRAKDYIRNSNKTTIQKDMIAMELDMGERTVREAISQLCDEGVTWLPMRQKGYGGWYLKLIGKEFDFRRMEEELHTLLRGLATPYFRRAIRYKALLKDHAKELKYPKDLVILEQLELAFGENEKEGN